MAVHEAVTELIDLHRPDLVAVERIFFSRNAQTALAVGHARGVVLLAAAEAGVAVREATPSEVKMAVAGHGGADKDQVARMLRLMLTMDELPTPDDAADALAVAVWAANTIRPNQRPTASVLDRAAIAPLEPGITPYERAVREALAAEEAKAPRGSSKAATRR
jgi:crossover junction endodeoxyribonuclease RuvC